MPTCYPSFLPWTSDVPLFNLTIRTKEFGGRSLARSSEGYAAGNQNAHFRGWNVSPPPTSTVERKASGRASRREEEEEKQEAARE